MRNVYTLGFWVFCTLLFSGMVLDAKGQASNTIKARRLAGYSGRVPSDYDYLIGTYQRQNVESVRAFLRSLGIRHRFLTTVSEGDLPNNITLTQGGSRNSFEIVIKYGGTPGGPLRVASGQAVFVIPEQEGFAMVDDDFKVEQAIRQITTTPLVDDFVLVPLEARGPGPEECAAYGIVPSFFFDDPAHPTPEQALTHLRRILGQFFDQFGGASLTLTQSGSRYHFHMTVKDMHGVVLRGTKDVERVDGEVSLARRIGEDVIDCEVLFDGQYAPMPFNRPPPDTRYANFYPNFQQQLEDFAHTFSEFLQRYCQATYNGGSLLYP